MIFGGVRCSFTINQADIGVHIVKFPLDRACVEGQLYLGMIGQELWNTLSQPTD